jgi:hypothetical protein
MARRTLASLVLAALCAAASGCLLPVRSAPGVEGRIVEAGSRRPLAGALVVVRFDGRHGNLLPDREKLGHVELRTDADGRFRVARHFSPGVALWPYFEGEARVLSVLADGYRCSSPQKVAPGVPIELALSAAADRRDQRASCRPVAARPGEAAAYMASWRALFDEADSDQALEDRRRVEQILVARSALGFADNCEGPVFDLALSPDGRRAAIAQREKQGTAVQVVDLTPGTGARAERAGVVERIPPRRLAWTSPRQLVAWVPTATPLRAAATARRADGRVEVLWNAPAESTSSTPRRASATPAGSSRPLEPEDIYDEGANRWAGRSFTLLRGVDASNGLAREQLRIVAPDGVRHEIELPGEPCGPTGHFGQPQYRIAADGLRAVDLRFIGGACRAVSIDLASGSWNAIDTAGRGRAECRNERRIPPSHLRVALRGYLRHAEGSLANAGADPTRAYLLRIEPSGAAQAETRDESGHTQHVALAPFPVKTPLRIVHVTNVAPVDGLQPAGPAPKAASRPAPPTPPSDGEQGLEPL